MNKVIYSCISIVLFSALSYAVYKNVTTPIAQFSWTTKQCVRFVDYKGNVSKCDLSKRYIKEWVK